MEQIESTYLYQHGGLVAVIVAGLLILLLTLVLSRLAVHLLNQALRKTTDGQVEGSIITNIIQVVMWVFGISFLVRVCFNYNTSVLWGALGIGGIALSLGLQNTISNLIGGLQISLSRDLTLGDWVSIGSVKGQIKDITWRVMKVQSSTGNNYIIPNSVLNTTAVEVLPPYATVTLPLVFADTINLVDVRENITKIAYDHLDKCGFLYEDKRPEITIDGTSISSIDATLTIYTRYECSSLGIRECVLPPIVDYLRSADAMAVFSK